MSEIKTVLPLPKPATIAIYGRKERFPVGRIFCIGRNYQEHAAEMSYGAVDKSQTDPIFFIKSACHVAHFESGEVGKLPYTKGTQNLHHEVELVLAFGNDIADGASKEEIQDAIYGYCVGLDMTRRDFQSISKKNGFPWDGAKDFEDSVILGELTEKSSLANPWMDDVSIKLSVNDEIRQDGDTSDLIWKIDECVSYLSKFYNLRAGDLIMTGTPSGVGPVVRGDVLKGQIAGLQDLVVEYI
ncbi:fumarylacetoacetate hydrolase family protein [Taylorella equigenitalis]|uniref:fumarylacetoacetate hydrolase family protein n=1 Tax=Taylorella equigenitalis TaxID=29575 RepID=UPI00237C8755|nr:fumarylacetoacetate hydrolase family protein [Taylorella equigenitalis]WDU55046.1 fumarylacetoacetate hydrolase family protein [Taylorella equigenitalis]